MELFKKTDCWISTGLITICTIITLVSLTFSTLIYCYAVVGGWQVISMLVHLLNHWFMRKGNARSRYHWLSFGLLVAALTGLIIPPFLFIILTILLFISPVLAVVYVSICYTELKELKLRYSLNLK